MACGLVGVVRVADPRAGVFPAGSGMNVRVPRRPAGRGWTRRLLLAVISAGGALGALGRYAVTEAFPAEAGGFPWATFAINVIGCLLIGVLMVLLTDVWAGRRLIRPFLGVGVLGGFTTFSTYVVDIQRLVDVGAAGTGLAYLAGTLTAALAATWTGLAAARWAISRVRRRHAR